MTNHAAPTLFGTARDKAELYLERYTILHQRTHRHELFTPPVIGSHLEESGSKFQLKTIETLLGSTSKVGDVIVLGMITQLKEGKFFLEDPTGQYNWTLVKLSSTVAYTPRPASSWQKVGLKIKCFTPMPLDFLPLSPPAPQGRTMEILIFLEGLLMHQ